MLGWCWQPLQPIPKKHVGYRKKASLLVCVSPILGMTLGGGGRA